MRAIHAAGGADGAELLAAREPLTDADVDAIEVRVQGLDDALAAAAAAAIAHAMHDAHDVAPAAAMIGGLDHAAVGDDEDRIAEIAVAAASAVPVRAEVRALAPERLRVVVAVGVGRADRKIEAVGE